MIKSFPSQRELTLSVLRALESEKRPWKSSEIDNFVAKDLSLTVDQTSQIRSGSRTELQYRLAWVRTKSKNLGYLEKVNSAQWTITSKGLEFLKG